MFLEERFDENFQYFASGGPVFNTSIQISNSGHEQRRQVWSEELNEYNLNIYASNHEEIMSIKKFIDFFKTVKGRAIPFRFKDFHDFKTNNAQLKLNNKNVYNIYTKTKTSISIFHEKKLNKIVDNTTKIYKNGSLFFDYTININDATVQLNPIISKNIISINTNGTIPTTLIFDQTHNLTANQKIYLLNSTSNLNNQFVTVNTVVDDHTITIQELSTNASSGNIEVYQNENDEFRIECEFDKAVRFDIDKIEYQNLEDGSIAINNIKIVEIRL